MTNKALAAFLAEVAIPLEVLIHSDSTSPISEISSELREQLQNSLISLRIKIITLTDGDQNNI